MVEFYELIFPNKGAAVCESLGESPKRWLMAVANCYFTPFSFEEGIYKFLGVRTFKKYIPTTGDLTMQIRQQKMLESGRTATLVAHARGFTIPCEILHLVGFVVFLFLHISFWANLLINVYPVMLQRYNRARIYRLLKKREHREITTTTSTMETLHA